MHETKGDNNVKRSINAAVDITQLVFIYLFIYLFIYFKVHSKSTMWLSLKHITQYTQTIYVKINVRSKALFKNTRKALEIILVNYNGAVASPKPDTTMHRMKTSLPGLSRRSICGGASVQTP